MYTISISNTLMAVSETLESAMKAVQQIIIKWDGEILNENAIHWVDGGLTVNPRYWYAKGKFQLSLSDTIYEVYIYPIEKV